MIIVNEMSNEEKATLFDMNISRQKLMNSIEKKFIEGDYKIYEVNEKGDIKKIYFDYSFFTVWGMIKNGELKIKVGKRY